MEVSKYKEVIFNGNCEKCKYYETDQSDDPCHNCLENPVNVHSHMPLEFVEKS